MKKRVFCLFIILSVLFLLNTNIIFAFDVNASFRTQNSPPVLSPIGNLTVFLNKIFLFTITATDPDLPQDSLTFRENSSLPDFIIVQDPPQNPTIIDARIEFVSSNKSLIGIHYVNISVVDVLGETDSEVIRLNVSLNNSPPIIVDYFPNLPLVVLNEGEFQKFNITVFDTDLPSDSLRYEWYFDNYIIPGQIFETFNYIPDFNSAGRHNLSVYVFDQFNLSDFHIWNLSIINVPADSGGGGSSGGGGGGSSCRANWTCTEWSPCPVYKIQIRTCVDKNQCPRARDEPPKKQSCFYLAPASCSDGILNGDELLIDCGGSKCKDCATCNDNIKNQDEEDVDCGGPCPRPCGLLYKPAFYPVCGDSKCEGIDALMCPGDCRSSLPIISIIMVSLTLYLVYAYRKLSFVFSLVNKKRHELDLLSSKRIPSQYAINNLNLIKNMLNIGNKDVLFKRYQSVIREFFSIFFLVQYEYTYEELKRDIRKSNLDEGLKGRISKLLDFIIRAEYKKEEIPFNLFKQILNESLYIIQALRIREEKVYHEYKIKQKTEKFNIIKLPIIVLRNTMNTFIYLENLIKGDTENPKPEKNVEECIITLRVELDNRNFEVASEKYKKIKGLYDKLGIREKNRYHSKLIIVAATLKKINS